MEFSELFRRRRSIHYFTQDEVSEKDLNLPPLIKPVAITPMGHTNSKEKPRPRKPLKELVYREAWNR